MYSLLRLSVPLAILLGFLSAAPTVPGCHYNGQIYQQGQTWLDGCKYTCKCLNASTMHYTCQALCPLRTAIPEGCRLHTPVGECCPKLYCKTAATASPTSNMGVCVYKGLPYREGTRWKDGCSYSCTCIDSTTGHYRCNPLCKSYTNVPPGCKLEKVDECCSELVCPHGNAMTTRDGTTVAKEVPVEIRATIDNLHIGAKADPSAQISNDSTRTMGTNSSTTPDGVLFVKDATGRHITESLTMPGDISLLTGNMSNTCEYKGKFYEKGDQWRDGCDYSCTCVDDRTGYYKCVSLCKTYLDIPQGCKLQKVDECCSEIVCENSRTVGIRSHVVEIKNNERGLLSVSAPDSPQNQGSQRQSVKETSESQNHAGSGLAGVMGGKSSMTAVDTRTPQDLTRDVVRSNQIETGDVAGVLKSTEHQATKSNKVVTTKNSRRRTEITLSDTGIANTDAGTITHVAETNSAVGTVNEKSNFQVAGGQNKVAGLHTDTLTLSEFQGERNIATDRIDTVLRTSETESRSGAGLEVVVLKEPSTIGKGCTYLGKVYAIDERWRDGCKYDCVCVNGKTGYYKCESLCKSYSDIPQGCRLEKIDECCSDLVCPGLTMVQAIERDSGVVETAPATRKSGSDSEVQKTDLTVRSEGDVGIQKTSETSQTVSSVHMLRDSVTPVVREKTSQIVPTKSASAAGTDILQDVSAGFTNVGCDYKGVYYQEGEQWKDGCKYNCTCLEGNTGFYRCVSLCKEYPDLPSGCTLEKVDECCFEPVCPTVGMSRTGAEYLPVELLSRRPALTRESKTTNIQLRESIGNETFIPIQVVTDNLETAIDTNQLIQVPYEPVSVNVEGELNNVSSTIVGQYTKDSTLDLGGLVQNRHVVFSNQNVITNVPETVEVTPVEPLKTIVSGTLGQVSSVPESNRRTESIPILDTPPQNAASIDTVKMETASVLSGKAVNTKTNVGTAIVDINVDATTESPDGTSENTPLWKMENKTLTIQTISPRLSNVYTVKPQQSDFLSPSGNIVVEPIGPIQETNMKANINSRVPNSAQLPLTMGKSKSKTIQVADSVKQTGLVHDATSSDKIDTLQMSSVEIKKQTGTPQITENNVVLLNPTNSVKRYTQQPNNDILEKIDTMQTKLSSVTKAVSEVTSVNTETKPVNEMTPVSEKNTKTTVVESKSSRISELPAGSNFGAVLKDITAVTTHGTSKGVSDIRRVVPSTNENVMQLNDNASSNEGVVYETISINQTATVDTCLYNGKYYKEESQWIDGCRYNCTCVDGRTGYYRCLPLCKTFVDVPEGCTLRKVDECCSELDCVSAHDTLTVPQSGMTRVNEGQPVDTVANKTDTMGVQTKMAQGKQDILAVKDTTFGAVIPGMKTNACAYKGNIYKEGEEWRDGCKYTCTCVDGQTGYYTCQSLCKHYPEIPTGCRLQKVDACCSEMVCQTVPMIQTESQSSLRSIEPNTEATNQSALELSGERVRIVEGMPTAESQTQQITTNTSQRMEKKVNSTAAEAKLMDAGCTYKDKVYEEGAQWRDGCKYNCVCVNGTTGYYKCETLCNIYTDLPAGCILRKADACCYKPVCSNSVNETTDGKSGQIIQVTMSKNTNPVNNDVTTTVVQTAEKKNAAAAVIMPDKASSKGVAEQLSKGVFTENSISTNNMVVRNVILDTPVEKESVNLPGEASGMSLATVNETASVTLDTNEPAMLSREGLLIVKSNEVHKVSSDKSNKLSSQSMRPENAGGLVTSVPGTAKMVIQEERNKLKTRTTVKSDPVINTETIDSTAKTENAVRVVEVSSARAKGTKEGTTVIVPEDISRKPVVKIVHTENMDLSADQVKPNTVRTKTADGGSKPTTVSSRILNTSVVKEKTKSVSEARLNNKAVRTLEALLVGDRSTNVVTGSNNFDSGFISQPADKVRVVHTENAARSDINPNTSFGSRTIKIANRVPVRKNGLLLTKHADAGTDINSIMGGKTVVSESVKNEPVRNIKHVPSENSASDRIKTSDLTSASGQEINSEITAGKRTIITESVNIPMGKKMKTHHVVKTDSNDVLVANNAVSDGTRNIISGVTSDSTKTRMYMEDKVNTSNSLPQIGSTNAVGETRTGSMVGIKNVVTGTMGVGCRYGENLFQEGSQWRDGCKYNCTCIDATTGYYKCVSLCKIYTSIPDVCTLRKIDDCCTEPVCPGYRISAVDQNGRMFKLVKESSGKQMKGQGSRTQVLTATTSTIQTAEAVQGASYSAKIISKDSTQLGVTTNMCEHNGQFFKEGGSWRDGCKYNCTCLSGSTGGFKCDALCKTYTEIPVGCTLEKVDDCCFEPVCPSVSNPGNGATALTQEDQQRPGLKRASRISHMTPSSTSVLAETLQKSGGRLIGRQARGGKVGTGMQSSAKKEKGCRYRGTVYQQGEMWKDGCKYNCQCVNGKIGYYACRQLCVDWTLPEECHIEPPADGKCCGTPVCPGYITINYPPNYVQN